MNWDREYRGPSEIQGLTKLWFGKHKGETVQDVLEDDPTYLKWCIEACEGFAEHLEEGLAAEIDQAEEDPDYARR